MTMVDLSQRLAGGIACVAVVRSLIEAEAMIRDRSDSEAAVNGARRAGADLADAMASSDLGPSAPETLGQATERLSKQSQHPLLKREFDWQESDLHVLSAMDLVHAHALLKSRNEERAETLIRDATRLAWFG